MSENKFNTTTDYELFWPETSIEFGVEALITMHILMMLISIPGNLLTIIVITTNKNLLDESAYLLICSVSVADLFVSIVAQPMNIVVLVTDTSRISKEFDLIFYFSIWGFCGASSFGIVFVTIDRYLYITYPMTYRYILSRKRTYLMIFIQWTCGLAFGAIPIIHIHKYAYPTAIASLVTFIAMIGCMSVVYIRIYKNIRNLKKHRGKRKQNNATITIALIVLAFFICWFPYIITNFIDQAGNFSSYSLIRAAYYWCLGLGCWNSALNVLIYSFKNATLNHEAKKLLRINRMRIEPFPFKKFQRSRVTLQNDNSQSTDRRQVNYTTFQVETFSCKITKHIQQKQIMINGDGTLQTYINEKTVTENTVNNVNTERFSSIKNIEDNGIPQTTLKSMKRVEEINLESYTDEDDSSFGNVQTLTANALGISLAMNISKGNNKQVKLVNGTKNTSKENDHSLQNCIDNNNY